MRDQWLCGRSSLIRLSCSNQTRQSTLRVAGVRSEEGSCVTLPRRPSMAGIPPLYA